MILKWFSNNSSERSKQITPHEEKRILAQFKEWMPRILGIPEVQAMITFDEAISYF